MILLLIQCRDARQRRVSLSIGKFGPDLGVWRDGKKLVQRD